MDLSEIRSCLDVTDAHVALAMEPARSLSDATPREKMLELVQHMARVATPRAGAAGILIVIAKMAPRDWMEGDVEVRLLAENEQTLLTLLVDDGLITQRLTAPLRIDAPLAEFAHAVRSVPHVLIPLQVQGPIDAGRMTLRKGSFSHLPKRSPSYSALASDLMPGIARRFRVRHTSAETPSTPEDSGPPTQRSPQGSPSDPPRRK